MSIANRLQFIAITLVLSSIILVSASTTRANPPEGENGTITTIERFSLILYDFDSANPGATNERILKEHVFPSIDSTTEITIAGYSDVVGQEEHNYQLALDRATRIAERIRRKFGKRGFKSLEVTAHREEEAPYRYEIAEGRLYSRTVIITLKKKGT